MNTFNQSQPSASAPENASFRNPSGSSILKTSLPLSPASIVNGQPMVRPDSAAPIGSLQAASSSSFNPAAAVESGRKAAKSSGAMSDPSQSLLLAGHLQSSEDHKAEQASVKTCDRQR